MAKTRQEKKKIIESIKEKVDQAKSIVFVGYKGLSVSETEELRGNLRRVEGGFGVTKNSMLKIALKSKKIDIDDDIYKKPVALAVSYLDEVASAKCIDQYSKEHQAIEILGGIMEGVFIDKEKVKQLAKLPSKDELYTKIVGSILSPISGMVNVLSGNIRGLVNVLNQYREKMS